MARTIPDRKRQVQVAMARRTVSMRHGRVRPRAKVPRTARRHVDLLSTKTAAVYGSDRRRSGWGYRGVPSKGSTRG